MLSLTLFSSHVKQGAQHLGQSQLSMGAAGETGPLPVEGSTSSGYTMRVTLNLASGRLHLHKHAVVVARRWPTASTSGPSMSP